MFRRLTPLFRLNFSEKTSFLKMMSEEKVSESTPNPFFNEKAAHIKQNIDNMGLSLKDWQAEFKKKHNRKPTLDDMKKDPQIANLMGSMKSEKQSLKSTIQRFRIN